MNNLLSRITGWFQPRPKKRTAFKLSQVQSTEKLIADLRTQKNIPPISPNQSFNPQHYRQLIGKLAKIAIATQRARRRKDE